MIAYFYEWRCVEKNPNAKQFICSFRVNECETDGIFKSTDEC